MESHPTQTVMGTSGDQELLDRRSCDCLIARYEVSTNADLVAGSARQRRVICKRPRRRCCRSRGRRGGHLASVAPASLAPSSDRYPRVRFASAGSCGPWAGSSRPFSPPGAWRWTGHRAAGTRPRPAYRFPCAGWTRLVGVGDGPAAVVLRILEQERAL